MKRERHATLNDYGGVAALASNGTLLLPGSILKRGEVERLRTFLNANAKPRTPRKPDRDERTGKRA